MMLFGADIKQPQKMIYVQ